MTFNISNLVISDNMDGMWPDDGDSDGGLAVTHSLPNNSNLLMTNSSQWGQVITADCELFLFMLYSVAMGILCILGFLGNTLSFLVLRHDRSTPVASFLLQILAIADNSFLLLWTIHYSIRHFFKYLGINHHLHVAWLYVRVYSFPLLYMAQTETIWLTVVIALNRFMAVCMPYKAPHLCTIYNVYKEVVIVTSFSILYNIPRFFELSIIRKINGNSTEIDWQRTYMGSNEIYERVYIDALYYMFSFVLPLLILAYVNTRVTIAYHASRQRKRRMTSRRADNENNITLVMIIVVLIFMLCQAPARIVQLVWSYQFTHCSQYQYFLIHISNTLEVLNSSVNFLIYFLFRKRFRDIIWDHFCMRPFVSMRRRDSQRATTTEGLSLAQFEPSNTLAIAAEHAENASVSDNNGNVVANHEHSSPTDAPNGDYRPPDEDARACDDIQDQDQDQIDTQPLSP